MSYNVTTRHAFNVMKKIKVPEIVVFMHLTEIFLKKKPNFNILLYYIIIKGWDTMSDKMLYIYHNYEIRICITFVYSK